VGYRREPWARRFFEQWRASLWWQRLRPLEAFAALIERQGQGWHDHCDGEFVDGSPRARR
jgi:transposase